MPKKDLVIALPYLGKLSFQIGTRINRVMKNKLPYCNTPFVLQTKCKISNFFTFRDKILSFLRSGIVYKCHCGGRSTTYLLRQTKRHVKVRMSQNTWEFLHSLGDELKVMLILSLKNIFYSAITHLSLKISQFLSPTASLLESCLR